MTNAPADLLGFRSAMETLTGLSANDVGIVGNGAHQRTGGYHEGKDTLVANGLWSSDYSVRLTRDRNGCTNSASATDVGAAWRQGRVVWLRWNNLLANALRAGDPGLAAVRAINYSPDGSTKWRIDRENGWRTESSSDTVDIHTHIELYRDTEGHRDGALTRIVAFAQQAITGQVVLASTLEDDMSALFTDNLARELDAVFNAKDTVLLDTGGGVMKAFPVPLVALIKKQAAPVVDVQALAAALAPQLGVDAQAVVAALTSDAGQAALVQAANYAEDH